jgi:AmiR/NasT family two-component response regulator
VQASDTPQRISEAVKESLRTRETISLARGILMERHDLGRDESLTRITAISNDTQTALAEIAATITERKNGTDTSEAH